MKKLLIFCLILLMFSGSGYSFKKLLSKADILAAQEFGSNHSDDTDVLIKWKGKLVKGDKKYFVEAHLLTPIAQLVDDSAGRTLMKLPLRDSADILMENSSRLPELIVRIDVYGFNDSGLVEHSFCMAEHVGNRLMPSSQRINNGKMVRFRERKTIYHGECFFNFSADQIFAKEKFKIIFVKEDLGLEYQFEFNLLEVDSEILESAKKFQAIVKKERNERIENEQTPLTQEVIVDNPDVINPIQDDRNYIVTKDDLKVNQKALTTSLKNIILLRKKISALRIIRDKYQDKLIDVREYLSESQKLGEEKLTESDIEAIQNQEMIFKIKEITKFYENYWVNTQEVIEGMKISDNRKIETGTEGLGSFEKSEDKILSHFFELKKKYLYPGETDMEPGIWYEQISQSLDSYVIAITEQSSGTRETSTLLEVLRNSARNSYKAIRKVENYAQLLPAGQEKIEILSLIEKVIEFLKYAEEMEDRDIGLFLKVLRKAMLMYPHLEEELFSSIQAN